MKSSKCRKYFWNNKEIKKYFQMFSASPTPASTKEFRNNFEMFLITNSAKYGDDIRGLFGECLETCNDEARVSPERLKFFEVMFLNMEKLVNEIEKDHLCVWRFLRRIGNCKSFSVESCRQHGNTFTHCPTLRSGSINLLNEQNVLINASLEGEAFKM